jgi:hypothetical protein
MIIILRRLADEDTSRLPADTIRLYRILPIPLPHKPLLILLKTIRTPAYKRKRRIIGELQGIRMETQRSRRMRITEYLAAFPTMMPTLKDCESEMAGRERTFTCRGVGFPMVAFYGRGSVFEGEGVSAEGEGLLWGGVVGASECGGTVERGGGFIGGVELGECGGEFVGGAGGGCFCGGGACGEGCLDALGGGGGGEGFVGGAFCGWDKDGGGGRVVVGGRGDYVCCCRGKGEFEARGDVVWLWHRWLLLLMRGVVVVVKGRGRLMMGGDGRGGGGGCCGGGGCWHGGGHGRVSRALLPSRQLCIHIHPARARGIGRWGSRRIS